MQAFEKRTGDRSDKNVDQQRRGAKLPAAYGRKIPRQQESLEILSGTAALVPEDGKLAGDQREERRNATEAVGPAHQRLGAPTSHTRAQTDDRKEVMPADGRIAELTNCRIWTRTQVGGLLIRQS